MKTFIAINVFNFISRLKLNKIQDRETRNSLITNHLVLRKVKNDFDGDVEELRNKIFDDKLPMVQAHIELKNQISAEPDEVKRKELEAQINPEIENIISMFEEQYNNLTNADRDIKLKEVPVEGFIDALVQNDIDFTLNDITEFQELGILSKE